MTAIMQDHFKFCDMIFNLLLKWLPAWTNNNINFDAWPRTTILTCKKKVHCSKNYFDIFPQKQVPLITFVLCFNSDRCLFSPFNTEYPPPPKKKGKKYEIIYKKLERVLWAWAYSYPISCRSVEFPASNGILCPIRSRYFQLVLELFSFLLC